MTRGQDIAWLAAAAALVWLALLLPVLVHLPELAAHDYLFFESWVLGEPRLTRASARVDGLYFVVSVAALLALWLLALRATARREATPALRRLAWGAALGFAAANVLQVPFTSADPFYYRGVGLVVAAGGNPYVDPVFREIPFVDPPVHARHHPPLWGPPMLWLLGAVTGAAGAGVLSGIYALKLANVAFHLLNLWLVGRIAREVAPGREVFALVLYGWSPLLVFEHVGVGHNDPPMLTGLLLSVWAVHRRRFAAACLALAAGAAFKVPALLAALPLVVVAFRTLGRRALAPLALGGAASALLLAALYAPFWAGADTFAGLAHFRPAAFGSPSQGLRLLLGLPPVPGPAGDPAALARGLEAFWLLAFALGCVALVRGLLRRPHADAVAYAEAVVALFLLYLVTEQRYYWSWYASWALALAAFGRPRSFAVRGAVALAAGSLLGSAAYRFVPPIAGFTPAVQWAAIVPSFGPLLAVGALALVRRLSQAPR